jgi:hypothetical protein
MQSSALRRRPGSDLNRGATMSDRPSAINGKLSQSWGTLDACPACGQCLCFGCHPTGPCVDDAARDDAATSRMSAGFRAGHDGPRFGVARLPGESIESTGVAGPQIPTSFA